MDIEYPASPAEPSGSAALFRDLRDAIIFALSLLVVFIFICIISFIGITLVFGPITGAILLDIYLSV